MSRADHKPQALKAKQVRLLDLFRQHGPISIRAITPHVKGDEAYQHIKDVHAQAENLCARGLIKPFCTGEREHGRRGVRPLLWIAT